MTDLRYQRPSDDVAVAFVKATFLELDTSRARSSSPRGAQPAHVAERSRVRGADSRPTPCHRAADRAPEVSLLEPLRQKRRYSIRVRNSFAITVQRVVSARSHLVRGETSPCPRSAPLNCQHKCSIYVDCEELQYGRGATNAAIWGTRGSVARTENVGTFVDSGDVRASMAKLTARSAIFQGMTTLGNGGRCTRSGECRRNPIEMVPHTLNEGVGQRGEHRSLSGR